MPPAQGRRREAAFGLLFLFALGVGIWNKIWDNVTIQTCIMIQLRLLLSEDEADYYTWSSIPRPTEEAALRRVMAQSRTGNRRQELTPRQHEAWALQREALRLGLNPARHVAKRLGIKTVSAYQLLQRARAKIHNLPGSVTFYYEGDYDLPHATRREIIAQRGRMTVRCAAHGTPGCLEWCSARYGICSACAKTYGYPDRMTPVTENWLPGMVKQVINQAYSDARRHVERQIIEQTPPGKALRRTI